MKTAQAIGDDTLQRRGCGRVSPESFTHGSAAQRVEWRQSEANAALARQQQIETRQRLMQIEAASEPTVSPAVPARPLYDVAQERSLREGASARRQQTCQGVTQIDDWLDRPN